MSSIIPMQGKSSTSKSLFDTIFNTFVGQLWITFFYIIVGGLGNGNGKRPFLQSYYSTQPVTHYSLQSLLPMHPIIGAL